MYKNVPERKLSNNIEKLGGVMCNAVGVNATWRLDWRHSRDVAR